MLAKQIVSEMQAALKSREMEKTVVLRNLMAEMRNREIDLKHELTDEEVITVIRKQVKVLTEAKEMYLKGQRGDLAAKNQQEIDVLTIYLPASISEEELTNKVKDIIARNPQVSNVGQLTGLCVRELKNVAESSQVAQLVRKLTQE